MTIIIVLSAILVVSYCVLVYFNLSDRQHSYTLECYAKCHKYFAYCCGIYVALNSGLDVFDSLLCALFYAALAAPSYTVVVLFVGGISAVIFNFIKKG